MNERDREALATFVIAILLGTVFLVMMVVLAENATAVLPGAG